MLRARVVDDKRKAAVVTFGEACSNSASGLRLSTKISSAVSTDFHSSMMALEKTSTDKLFSIAMYVVIFLPVLRSMLAVSVLIKANVHF